MIDKYCNVVCHCKKRMRGARVFFHLRGILRVTVYKMRVGFFSYTRELTQMVVVFMNFHCTTRLASPGSLRASVVSLMNMQCR